LIRWLTLFVGVGVAAAALHALLSTPVDPRPRRAPPPVAARKAPRSQPKASEVHQAARPPAHGDIDAASRPRLELVLRESEAEDAAR
jgi:hypothetical protein